MNLTSQIETIAATALFRSLQIEELLELLSIWHGSLLQSKKGSMLHMKNEPCLWLDLILKGRAGLQSTDAEGNVLSVHLLGKGEIIGAGLLFASDNRYPMMAVAESNVTILRLPRDAILWLCSRNADFTREILREISDRAAMMAERMHAMAYQSIRRRISDYLMMEYEKQQHQTITLPITKKQIAEQFGIQPQSLSRELNKMRREGLLEYDHRTIRLKEGFFISG